MLTQRSNGVRFSISDISPSLARIAPTIFQDRSAISLYDAQHSTGAIAPIPSATIEALRAALIRFKEICEDFDVQNQNVRVVATEATRNAINRDDMLHEIKDSTGWDVQLLAKEEEGRLGAMGIASSVAHLSGICIDMGGGSVQLTWMTKQSEGAIDMGPSISFPYGAAALMSRFANASESVKDAVLDELTANIQQALQRDLQIPAEHWEAAKVNNGFNLYLSGGGLRGLGHILMSRETVQPYPISILNGYTTSGAHFFSVLELGHVDSQSFRISARRALQLPAVILLVKAFKQAHLQISQVTFAQGGVHEGLLYSEISPSIRSQSPLVVSTAPYAPCSAATFVRILWNAVPCPLEADLLEATINLLHHHGSLPKDVRAAAALRSTSTGVLAGVHGLGHRDRSLLGLILCERWDGDISAADQSFYDSLQELSGPMCWWTKFIGRLAKGIADLYPAGVVHDEGLLTVDAKYPVDKDTLSATSISVMISVPKSKVDYVEKTWAPKLEKLGKRKNWPSGKGGFKVNVEVVINA